MAFIVSKSDSLMMCIKNQILALLSCLPYIQQALTAYTHTHSLSLSLHIQALYAKAFRHSIDTKQAHIAKHYGTSNKPEQRRLQTIKHQPPCL